MFHGGGTGERDEIGPFLPEACLPAADVVRLGDRAIGNCNVHDGAELGELVGDDVAGFLGAGEEDFQVFDRAVLLEGGDHGFGDVFLGLKVHVEVVFAPLGGGGRADGGDAGPAEFP